MFTGRSVGSDICTIGVTAGKQIPALQHITAGQKNTGKITRRRVGLLIMVQLWSTAKISVARGNYPPMLLHRMIWLMKITPAPRRVHFHAHSTNTL